MYCKYQGSKLDEIDNSANEMQPDGSSNNKSTKKHYELLKSSGETLRKLEEVRQTKKYEMMKYEMIARMNASSVSAYLRQQRLKPDIVLRSETDGISQKHRDETKNHAATIIQQFFRRTIHQKQIDRISCIWKWIPLEKRIRYIEAIAERMSGGTIPRRIDHSIIKNKLDEHKRTMYANIDNYIQREQLVKHIKNDLTLLNSIASIDDLMKVNSNNFSTQKTITTIK